MLKKFKDFKVLVALRMFAILMALSLVVASRSFATGLDLTGVTFDMTPINAYALVIISALAVMWVIRKAIKTTNKS